jgi:hypothetical protein
MTAGQDLPSLDPVQGPRSKHVVITGNVAAPVAWCHGTWQAAAPDNALNPLALGRSL